MSAGWERLWHSAAPERPLERLTRAPLDLAALAFRGAVESRRLAYDLGMMRSRRVEGVRIVSLGNLTVGGAGKTPAVAWLAREAAARGRRAAILSRGYGRKGSEPLIVGVDEDVDRCGDEPLLLARSCPGVPVLVGSDRLELARRARDELGAELLYLDDGMQHRRLARDVDVAVVDGRLPFGNGRLLPRGPLREPPSALARATLLWVRAPLEHPALVAWEGPRVVVRYGLSAVVPPGAPAAPLSTLTGQQVALVTGIARPRRLLEELEGLGVDVVERHLFPDHHRFSSSELARLRESAEQRPLVTTAKDAVRLPGDLRLWALEQALTVLEGDRWLDRLGIL